MGPPSVCREHFRTTARTFTKRTTQVPLVLVLFREMTVLTSEWLFCDVVDRFYSIEIKDTTDAARSASYHDIHLEIDSEGRIRTKLYDKRDDFNFPIVNFPSSCSNIQATPAYVLYISQLIRYCRACGSYHDFCDRRLLLTRKLLNQAFLVVKLKSLLLRSPPWLGWPLRNACVINNHGYVSFVVVTIIFFSHSLSYLSPRL